VENSYRNCCQEDIFFGIVAGESDDNILYLGKDKSWEDLLVALGLVVSILCHFRLCNSFILRFFFLVYCNGE
jgi:hypothetical protein